MGEKSTLLDFFSIECRKSGYVNRGGGSVKIFFGDFHSVHRQTKAPKSPIKPRVFFGKNPPPRVANSRRRGSKFWKKWLCWVCVWPLKRTLCIVCALCNWWYIKRIEITNVLPKWIDRNPKSLSESRIMFILKYNYDSYCADQMFRDTKFLRDCTTVT